MRITEWCKPLLRMIGDARLLEEAPRGVVEEGRRRLLALGVLGVRLPDPTAGRAWAEPDYWSQSMLTPTLNCSSPSVAALAIGMMWLVTL